VLDGQKTGEIITADTCLLPESNVDMTKEYKWRNNYKIMIMHPRAKSMWEMNGDGFLVRNNEGRRKWK